MQFISMPRKRIRTYKNRKETFALSTHVFFFNSGTIADVSDPSFGLKTEFYNKKKT